MYISPELQELIDDEEWDFISVGQVLSEEFIEEYQDRLNWVFISQNQILSEDFIAKHIDRVRIRSLANNTKLNIIVGTVSGNGEGELVKVTLTHPIILGYTFFKTGTVLEVVDCGTSWEYLMLEYKTGYASEVYRIPSHAAELVLEHSSGQ